MRFKVLSIATCVLLLSLPVMAQNPCEVPDNGTGTVDLPPDGCDYLSPNEFHEIVNGLPVGTTIRVDPIHQFFLNPQRMPGGSLGGEIETFDSTLTLTLTGSGELEGFNREMQIEGVNCEVHTGERDLGAPVQEFPNDMFRLQGGIVGDPDFDELTFAAGTDFGMPSPGQTKLTELPSGDFAVDSFFDITYQIDFVGAAGSQLEGMAGSTQATLRMETGLFAPDIPTTTPWGLILLAALIVGAGAVVVRRRQALA